MVFDFEHRASCTALGYLVFFATFLRLIIALGKAKR